MHNRMQVASLALAAWGVWASGSPTRVSQRAGVDDSMFPIAEAAYHARGGTSPRLPGRADLIKGGRADVRFSIDAAGELYLYSKSDGVIRKVVGARGF